MTDHDDDRPLFEVVHGLAPGTSVRPPDLPDVVSRVLQAAGDPDVTDHEWAGMMAEVVLEGRGHAIPPNDPIRVAARWRDTPVIDATDDHATCGCGVVVGVRAVECPGCGQAQGVQA